MKNALLAALLIGLSTIGALWWWHDRTSPPAPIDNSIRPVTAHEVGAAACAACHAAEQESWQSSQHARAMAEAGDRSVLGDFSGARFTHAGITSTFFRRNGGFYVNTDGPDGKMADFEIGYTFGVEPLQQYLVKFPGGRMQALGIAWDSRPKKAGGQHWFHLYPDQKLKAGDPLHWTGIDQNWNFQCADCHSTNLRKNYDPQSRTYATTWSEINVSCEACHGPGSNHLLWARKLGDWRQFDVGHGLGVALDERKGVTWSLLRVTANSVPSTPRTAQREIEVCARCHSRRGQFSY